MDTYVEKQADNLDDAFSNFDPNLPLKAGSPFFVQQSRNPLGPLRRGLLRGRRTPMKHFIAGFKGAGKSTQINQLAADPALNAKYFVVNFSIKDTCDERNIDYVDLLTAIGAKVFQTYADSGRELDGDLLRDLESWGKRVVDRINTKDEVLEVEAKAGGGVNFGVFFAKITAKAKAEASSRTIIREVLEPQLTELLENINLIAAGIQAETQKEVLVFVDDTDKPLPEQATRLFKEHLAPLLEPAMHIIYTVPVWMRFSPEFPEIREPEASMLPNLRLYDRNTPQNNDLEGIEVMRKFASARMDSSLIDDDAATLAITKSGGVYREAARIFQIAIDRALEDGRSRVELSDVEIALNDRRREFRRLIPGLDQSHIETLRTIGEKRTFIEGGDIGKLLDNLLVLEYVDDAGDNWPDLHPLLRDVLM